MTAIDKNEVKSKDGSGRVQIYKQFNLIHSYTLELGYHSPITMDALAEPVNLDVPFSKKLPQYRFMQDPIENRFSPYYTNDVKPRFTIESYENMGKTVCLSILDIFNVNHYSRIPNTPYKSIDEIRKEIAKTVGRLERFRRSDISKKKNKVSELAHEMFYSVL